MVGKESVKSDKNKLFAGDLLCNIAEANFGLLSNNKAIYPSFGLVIKVTQDYAQVYYAFSPSLTFTTKHWLRTLEDFEILGWRKIRSINV